MQDDEVVRNEIVKSAELNISGPVPTNMQQILSRAVVKLRFNGQEIEIPLGELHIHGGQANRGATSYMCPNCHDRIPRTGDIQEDHHAMQRHRIEQCGKRATAEDENTQLREEFAAQPRMPLQLAAAAPPGRSARLHQLFFGGPKK